MKKRKVKRIKPRNRQAQAMAEMGVKPKVIPNRKPVIKPKTTDWD